LASGRYAMLGVLMFSTEVGTRAGPIPAATSVCNHAAYMIGSRAPLRASKCSTKLTCPLTGHRVLLKVRFAPKRDLPQTWLLTRKRPCGVNRLPFISPRDVGRQYVEFRCSGAVEPLEVPPPARRPSVSGSADGPNRKNIYQCRTAPDWFVLRSERTSNSHIFGESHAVLVSCLRD
jgi:hypothetical protein